MLARVRSSYCCIAVAACNRMLFRMIAMPFRMAAHFHMAVHIRTVNITLAAHFKFRMAPPIHMAARIHM